MEDFEEYAQAFTDGLIDGGVGDVVICPGSRSTPLAIAFARRAADVKQWVLYDERSAGFFALGVAKSSSSPVAVVCTSGTAAANLLPAVIEAKLGRVPVIAVTADRPPEVRDFGGAQTIDQVGLFGSHVMWFHDLPVAAKLDSLLRYARMVGVRASNTASSAKGPVHINFSFREPLVSPSTMTERAVSPGAVEVIGAQAQANREDLSRVAAELKTFEKGFIVVGPGEYPPGVGHGLAQLSHRLGWPILADVLSNLRQDGAIRSGLVRGYEFLLRGDFRSDKPECILRLGGIPTSKELNTLCSGVRTVLLDDRGDWRDPEFWASIVVFGDLESSLSGLVSALTVTDESDKEWWNMWTSAGKGAEARADDLLERGDEMFEGKLFHTLSKSLRPEAPLTVVVGSSMPVRDLDYFFLRGSKNIRFSANRGANGIDGVVSTAMGVSAVEGDVMLILGDISFYHDMNGLLASKLYNLNATVIVINNRGGGIFSFLSQHSLPSDVFERLFGEAHDLDFSGVKLIYGGEFTRVSDWPAFAQAIASRGKGLRIIEVRTPDRERNIELHKQTFEALAAHTEEAA
jgi:2-succinyl-5-enolpyruvyl-6-hydroxy-3-cyclohexene-1-carboxylate synthase